MMPFGTSTGPSSPGHSASVSAAGDRAMERKAPPRSVSLGAPRPQSGRSVTSSAQGTESGLSANAAADLGIVQVHQEGGRQLAVPQDSMLLVSACGRTCQVDMRAARTMIDLQGALQRTLQMDGQTFCFFDVNGTSLQTDMQIREAITSGLIPLCATLTDASIHYIENRREELAQMQWKLVRDQMTGATGKVASVSRTVGELSHQMETHKKETAGLADRLRAEMFKSLESERDIAQMELRQLSERVNAVAQLVNGERNKREVSVQNVEKQVIGVRDMLENERATRRQDLTLHMSTVQDVKAQIEDVKVAREAFEDKHAFEIHGVTEKIDMVSRHYADMLQDQVLAFKKCTEEVNSALQQQNRQVIRLRSEAETSLAEAQARFTEVEERCGSLENRFSEAASRQAAGLDRLSERHERVSQAVESLRLEEKEHKGQVQSAIDRVKDLEATLATAEGETRDMVLKERQARDDQVKRTQNAVISQQTQQISDLEKKIAERLERESTERERNVTDLVTDVSRRLQDGPGSVQAPAAQPKASPVQAPGQVPPTTVQVISAHQQLLPPNSLSPGGKSPGNSVTATSATAERRYQHMLPQHPAGPVTRGGSAIVAPANAQQQPCGTAAVQYQKGSVRQVQFPMASNSFAGRSPSADARQRQAVTRA